MQLYQRLQLHKIVCDIISSMVQPESNNGDSATELPSILIIGGHARYFDYLHNKNIMGTLLQNWMFDIDIIQGAGLIKFPLTRLLGLHGGTSAIV